MSEPIEWIKFFDKAFHEIKMIIWKQYPLEDDGSGSPETLAFREVVESFPCPIKLVEIKIDRKIYPDIQDETCQMIKYDFVNLGQRKIEYYGIIKSKNKEKLQHVLTTNFEFDKESFESFYKDFRTIGWSDDSSSFYVQFSLYNIRDNLKDFVWDFAISFQSLLGHQIVERFKRVIDFNLLSDLKPDKILSLEEVTRIDPATQILGKNIEQFQKQICDSQLLPAVPEHPRRVFESAKKLYIFGYFYYRFFTISEHYAYLALESAIRHRYNQSLGAKAVITNPKGEAVESSPSWFNIFNFCERNWRKWKLSEIKVNGEKFPFNNKLLLDWLVKEKIITKWERRQYDVGIILRNVLSHQEFAPIYTPNSSTLKIVADRINKLFYKT